MSPRPPEHYGDQHEDYIFVDYSQIGHLVSKLFEIAVLEEPNKEIQTIVPSN